MPSQCLSHVEAGLDHIAPENKVSPYRRATCFHERVTPEEFLEGSALGLAVYERLAAFLVNARPDVTVRASKSQVAFRLKAGFAYLWRPDQYLGARAAPLVLAIAHGDEIPSARFKEIAHPSPHLWIHHLEIRELSDVDAEVEAWLLMAADEAGSSPAAAPPRPRR